MLKIDANCAKVKQTCPMCGTVCEMELDREESMSYFWENNLIQDAFPDLTATEREFVKSGYCPDCQQLLFGNSETDKIVRLF